MRLPTFIALISLLAAAGCELAPTETGLGPPRVRVVNAASGSTVVTVYLDNAQVGLAPDLVFKAGSECLLVAPGTHTFTFTQSSGTLGTATAALENGKAYTVILVGSGSTFRVVALSDNDATPANNNGLRFINATSTAGDVYVTAPDAAPSASTKAAGNLAVLASSTGQPPYVFRATTDTRIRLFDVGTTTVARSDLSLALLPISRLANIIFVPQTSGSDPGALQFNACN